MSGWTIINANLIPWKKNNSMIINTYLIQQLILPSFRFLC